MSNTTTFTLSDVVYTKIRNLLFDRMSSINAELLKYNNITLIPEVGEESGISTTTAFRKISEYSSFNARLSAILHEMEANLDEIGNESREYYTFHLSENAFTLLASMIQDLLNEKVNELMDLNFNMNNHLGTAERDVKETEKVFMQITQTSLTIAELSDMLRAIDMSITRPVKEIGKVTAIQVAKVLN